MYLSVICMTTRVSMASYLCMFMYKNTWYTDCFCFLYTTNIRLFMEIASALLSDDVRYAVQSRLTGELMSSRRLDIMQNHILRYGLVS